MHKLIDRYTEFGWDGLKDCKIGRPETVLNSKAEEKIIDLFLSKIKIGVQVFS